MKKKLTLITLLIGSSTVSLFASGASGCDGIASSGCGAWWQNYTLGTSTDGAFSHSTGVGVAYTANYSSVSASQDPLSAAFPWISSSPALSTSDASGSYGSLLAGISTVSTTTSNIVTGESVGGFGSILFSAAPTPSLSVGATQGATTNVASLVPTNTGGSTTMALFSDGAANSYSSYLAQIYGLAYGNQTQNMNVNPNAIGNADPIVPEPSSYLMIATGLAAVAYARRKKA